MRTGSLQVLSDASIGSGLDANAAALLDMSSTSRGMKLPNMTETQRNAIGTPPAGLSIYNTTTNQINYYDGTQWIALSTTPPVDFWRIHDADGNTFVRTATSAVDNSNQILGQIGDPTGYTANQTVLQIDTTGSSINGLNAAVASNNPGTGIFLLPGNGDSTGLGGSLTVIAGEGGALAAGGSCSITTGVGGANSGALSLATATPNGGNAGDILLIVGNAADGGEIGGSFSIQGGNVELDTGDPATISIIGGTNTSSADTSKGQKIIITAGDGYSTGNVEINTQDVNGDNGIAGNIVLTPGVNTSGDNSSAPGNSLVYGGATIGNGGAGFALVKGGSAISGSLGEPGYAGLSGGDNDNYLGASVRSNSGNSGIDLIGGTYIEPAASTGTGGTVTLTGGTGNSATTSIVATAGNIRLAGGGGGATLATAGGLVALAGGDGGTTDGWVQIGTLDHGSSTPSQLRFLGNASGSNYVSLRAPTTLASYDLILPQAAGTVGQSLQYGTGGQLQWANSPGSYTTTFVNGDLTSGVLTVTHSLNQTPVLVQVFDNNNLMISPDEITLTSNNVTDIDLTSFGAITGTWSVIVNS